MKLQDIVQNIKTLPAGPAVLPKLVRLMEQEVDDNDSFVEIIALDPALTAQVLRLSNSAAFAPASPITDLGDAVARLGIREIYRIVTLLSGGDYLIDSVDLFGLARGELWEHSLAVAFIMETLVTDEDTGPGLAYTIGLLHDLGKTVLELSMPKAYEAVFDRVENDHWGLARAERDLLGFDHAEVGCALLRHWGFGDVVCLPVGHHYHPLECPEHQQVACALHVANWGAGILGYNHGRDAWALEIEPAVVGVLGIEQNRLERSILQAGQQIHRARMIVGDHAPKVRQD
ncbi:MAG: HDOD domain-containing protein [Puniceicoccaceae bacterium]|nr:MAG: HDOD domain-containing protein [Puniceicoccaceae bacterium]